MVLRCGVAGKAALRQRWRLYARVVAYMCSFLRYVRLLVGGSHGLHKGARMGSRGGGKYHTTRRQEEFSVTSFVATTSAEGVAIVQNQDSVSPSLERRRAYDHLFLVAS
jgi:hypothetical protein